MSNTFRLVYRDGKIDLEPVVISEDLLNERAADAIKESDILILMQNREKSMPCMFKCPEKCWRKVAEGIYDAICIGFSSEQEKLSSLEKALLVHDAIMRLIEE